MNPPFQILPYERIFCNRSVNMESIKAIGFDMDYTLVLYKPYAFETLFYHETLKKLVENGYPDEILSWELNPTALIRGLVVDKKRGNILKLDRHFYVKNAYHAFRELSKKERHTLYDIDKVISYHEPDFAFLDSSFSIAEAFLMSQLVQYKDNHNVLKEKSYFDFYSDVKKYLDLSHRDDKIKSKIAENPEQYLNRDPFLPDILYSLKKMGKKLFILTNALWEYVNPIMHYLLPNTSETHKHWTDYFDFIMTGAQKPQFFSSKNLMYEVNPFNGLLKNLPNTGLPIDAKVKIFQGGHVQPFHNMLSVSRGSEILYVGDHIYGDIVRSKKGIGWRTLIIIEELEDEMKQKFHPVWGALMKTGKLNSFFSAQMAHYACLYTSKLTNLRHYNGHKIFHAVPDILPHDFLEQLTSDNRKPTTDNRKPITDNRKPITDNR